MLGYMSLLALNKMANFVIERHNPNEQTHFVLLWIKDLNRNTELVWWLTVSQSKCWAFEYFLDYTLPKESF